VAARPQARDLRDARRRPDQPRLDTTTGAQIIEMLRLTTNGERGILQVSGLRYTIDEAKDAGKPPAVRNRLVAITMEDGSPIDPAKLYRVAMPDFLTTGGEGLQPVMQAVPPDRINITFDRTLRDVFADVLKTFPQPLVPKSDGRITVLNARPADSR